MSHAPGVTAPGRAGRGTVTAFDEHRGWGEITTADDVVLGFHCASLSDGTRTIPVGTAVRFVTLAKLGRIEAASVERDA